MAQKTRLSPNEIANLLMESPLTVCDWMQKGMLHAEVAGIVERPFTLGDVAQFARDKGLQFNRPDRGRLRILIVTNDRQSEHQLVELLDTLSETAEAVTAHNTFDVGRKMTDFQPDIVLIESQMPRQESIEMCRYIKSDHATRHVQIITVLKSMDHEYRQRLLMAGADTCLVNPVNNEALLDVMGLCLSPRREKEGAHQDL
jgi:CheY-like chemotaxis protein